ncbi:pilus assembly protein [Rheinheimera gaetbuli]
MMKSNKPLSWLAFTLSLMFGISTAKAAVDIAEAPLQTGSAVAANIYFVLDDSGSMQWEVMPDDYVFVNGQIQGYLFPLQPEMYGGLNHFDRRIPTFDSDNIHNVIKRSSEINKVFYNPVADYAPWKDWTNKSMGNVNPEAAPWDPKDDDPGTINLTTKKSFDRWYYSTSSLNQRETSNSSKDYWPITYYVYKGSGSAEEIKNYTGYQIRGDKAYTRDMSTSTGWQEKTTKFTWNTTETIDGKVVPKIISRTIAEEKQHFANWFSYYRSRILAARAGTSDAFAAVPEGFRIGFKTLSNDASKTLKIPLPQLADIEKGTFFGSNKENWFKKLFEVPMNNSTPLRNALKWVGDEYSSDSATGPWGPGAAANQISCRQSFAILTTDGYYNGPSPGVDNIDKSNGPLHKHPTDEKKDFQYKQEDPYSDDFSDTLADVAMKYWMNDLRELDNNVPVANGSKNPAFWQHMVTHAVSLGVKGTKDPKKDTPGNWKDPQAGNSEKIDDLWHATINGRGEFIAATSPTEYKKAINDILKAIRDVTSTSSNLAGSTTSLETSTGLFRGRFSSGDWSGDLSAFDANNNFKETWSAAKQLDSRDYSSRAIYFGSTATSALKFIEANVSDSVLSDDQVNYIRGNRDEEQKEGGTFRNRGSVLGDIAHSTPLLVEGIVNRNYQLYGWGSGYEDFREAMFDRESTVYVGANDGMLHAFDAKTGDERFAYIPNAALSRLAALTDPNYIHQYYVDGSPVVADIKDGSGNWKSILVGSMGRGGETLFALDITDPKSFDENSMLWDRSYPALGKTTSRPLVARLNTGKWVAIIGYGYNNNKASQGGLLVIDVNNGNTLWQIDLPASVGADNGLGQVEGWDADGDGNLDWVFAGDLHGNIWKFDLSVADPQTNGIAYGGNPLFIAKSEAGAKQSITGGITLGKEPGTGQLWVYFGTGRMLSNADPINTDQQSWYGIKDGSMVIDRKSQLVKRELANVGTNARVIEEATSNDLAAKRGWVIDLLDTRERIVEKPQMRSANLGSSRVSTLVVASTVPTSDFCSPSSDGWVMAINPFTGGKLKVHYFDRSGDKKFDDKDAVKDPVTARDTVASGVKFDGMQGDILIVDETGTVTTLENMGLNTGAVAGRVSWREMSN